MKANHSQPIPVKQLDQHFKPRDALKKTPIALERRFHVAADRNRRSRPGLNASTAATVNRIGR